MAAVQQVRTLKQEFPFHIDGQTNRDSNMLGLHPGLAVSLQKGLTFC